jgi:deoxyribodipyrimidine photolyase-related protein
MQTKQTYHTLRLILGDQLNTRHSWFNRKDDTVLYAMMELRSESEYVTHHIQKVAGIFAAMRAFADNRRAGGHHVHYIAISDVRHTNSFAENLQTLINEYQVQQLEYMEPDEYRLDQHLKKLSESLSIPSRMVSSEHFLTERCDLGIFFKGKKQYLMEHFYRFMRKQHNVLLTSSGQPEGGQWNFDKENRSKMPAGHIPPKPLLFHHDVTGILEDIQHAGLPYFGHINPSGFIWPVTSDEAWQMFDYFLESLLPCFGSFQDALSQEHWSLYHSRISFALNIKLIDPLTVIRKTQAYWREHPHQVSLAQAEGFIRQILGWREYMRGIYWHHMPDLASANFFGHTGKLPSWFWTGETHMQCIKKAINQSLEYAYAHHIQRLMVTGNFALLAGIHPSEVDRWYLGIYMDAFEWVEITNTRGMSQYADGGIVATKPYVSSAAYLHKMGDHCQQCRYDYALRTGSSACPFNSLYWHFLERHAPKLRKNPRMTMMYRVWDKFDADTKADILGHANTCLQEMDTL